MQRWLLCNNIFPLADETPAFNKNIVSPSVECCVNVLLMQTARVLLQLHIQSIQCCNTS